MKQRTKRLLSDSRWRFARAYCRVRTQRRDGPIDDSKAVSQLAADVGSSPDYIRKVLNCDGGTRHLGPDAVRKVSDFLGPALVKNLEIKPAILGNPDVKIVSQPPPTGDAAAIVNVEIAGEIREAVLLPAGVKPKAVTVSGKKIKVEW